MKPKHLDDSFPIEISNDEDVEVLNGLSNLLKECVPVFVVTTINDDSYEAQQADENLKGGEPNSYPKNQTIGIEEIENIEINLKQEFIEEDFTYLPEVNVDALYRAEEFLNGYEATFPDWSEFEGKVVHNILIEESEVEEKSYVNKDIRGTSSFSEITPASGNIRIDAFHWLPHFPDQPSTSRSSNVSIDNNSPKVGTLFFK